MRSGKARQVGAGLRVLRVQLQRALKIPARAFCLPAMSFEHAEIVPAVGVILEELQGQLLLGNCLLQITAPCKHLRQRRMDERIIRLQFRSFV